MYVQWNGDLSEPIHHSDGVKQGRAISPLHFSVYMDEVLKTLKQQSVVYMTGNNFLGSLSYTDDIILDFLAIHGLQKFIDHSKLNIKYSLMLKDYIFSNLLWFAKIH